MQVFDLENKKKLASRNLDAVDDHDVTVPASKSVVQYWTWMNANEMAVIANNAFFHWNIIGESQPNRFPRVYCLLTDNACEKVHDLGAWISEFQICRFRVETHTNAWSAGVAIQPDTKGVIDTPRQHALIQHVG
jgi:hypothetical protein